MPRPTRDTMPTKRAGDVQVGELVRRVGDGSDPRAVIAVELLEDTHVVLTLDDYGNYTTSVEELLQYAEPDLAGTAEAESPEPVKETKATKRTTRKVRS